MPPKIDQTRPDQTRPDYDYPYAYLYNGENYSEGLRVNQFSDRKLSYRVVRDCFILPFTRINEGGLFDAGGNYIKGSSWREGGGWPELEDRDNSGTNLADLAELQGMRVPEARHVKDTAVYAGIFMGAWGHFITDSMRMLWFLRSREYAENFSQCRIAYLPGNNFRLEGNYRRLLEILGVDCSKLVPVTELTGYDAVVLPDESFFMDLDNNQLRFFTQEYRNTVDAVRDFAIENMRPSKFRKVYYSYSRYTKNKSIGEDKLERYFASKGYEVICPETLSLDEQLNILANCESFAATIGSCSYNMIFLRDNTEVILIPRSYYIGRPGYHSIVNKLHSLRITHVDSSFSFLSQFNSGPFLYFISSHLRKYFHDENTESIIDASDFWKYVRMATGYKFGRDFGTIIPQNNAGTYSYYAPVAAEYFRKICESSWPYRFRQMLKRLLRRN